LFDTYGFPIDLTRLIAAEQGLAVDEAGFEKGLQEQKTRSRAATALDTEDWVILKEGNPTFVGYDSLESKTEVLRYRKVKAKGKESYQIVLAETPFYAESGGQVGDTGQLTIGHEKLPIIDTKKENDLIIHFTENIPADLSGTVSAVVDKTKRTHTEVHHSATHLLHAALRKVLGTHVAQKGSLVNADYLRFDVSHFAKITDEEIQQVETIVNEKIRENIPVVIKQMPKEDAMKTGAMALFGEKYGDVVRVVIIDPEYSVELCGGTHVGSTGELGFFKITSESAVAAGVRRIEAVSGKAAENHINALLQELQLSKALLKNPKQLNKSIEGLIEESISLRKSLESLESKSLGTLAKELAGDAANEHGIAFAGRQVEVSSAESLRKLAAEVLRELSADEASACVLTAEIAGKASVAVGISQTLVDAKGFDAGKMIKEIVAPLINGGGGGSKTLATAGGQNTGKLNDVIAAVRDKIHS